MPPEVILAYTLAEGRVVDRPWPMSDPAKGDLWSAVVCLMGFFFALLAPFGSGSISEIHSSQKLWVRPYLPVPKGVRHVLMFRPGLTSAPLIIQVMHRVLDMPANPEGLLSL